MNKVIKAEMREGSKFSKGGIWLHFKTIDNVQAGNLFSFSFNDGNHSFKVGSVSADCDILEVSCYETGYWAFFLDRIPDLNIRLLLGCPLLKITDEERIKEIKQSSTFC